MIRPATDADLPGLRDIERSAGQAFREIGMAPVADDEPPSLEVLRGYTTTGRAWVVERDGHPVGYLLADIVDGMSSRCPCTPITRINGTGGPCSTISPTGPLSRDTRR